MLITQPWISLILFENKNIFYDLYKTLLFLHVENWSILKKTCFSGFAIYAPGLGTLYLVDLQYMPQGWARYI